MDSSEIGRYGTISFMKRLEPDTVVAAFPIDEEQVTFGRDPKCSVRLYYKAVSLFHCKIIFEERKAFLGVLGENGLIVDGCKVFPSPSSSKPTTIPLSNNSDIEIHNKRFRFTYPPRQLRAALLATPSHPSSIHTPNSRRALRMSMIQSAQVFSPRPSKDPRENLRVLQSPLKPFRTPVKSTHQHECDSDEEDDQDEIVLVDGNNPRVVEEEKDLIIFEDVEVEDNEDEKTSTQPSYGTARTPGRKVAFTVPSDSPRTPQLTPQTESVSLQPQPQTPARRIPRPSLHRAVLIRSAQRAVMQAEMEKEDEEEEKEVEEFIATDIAIAERASDEGEGSDQDDDEMDWPEDNPAVMTTSTWKKKLHVAKMWPFSSAQAQDTDEGERDIIDVDKGPTESRSERYDDADDNDEDENDNNDTTTHGKSQVQRPAPNPRSLGNFMTPQPNHVEITGRGRKSYAGPGFDRADGGARRVAVEQAWRVKDIVLPEREVGGIKTEDQGEKQDVLAWKGVGRGGGRERERLSEEERKAIQDRRRSALTTPDTFFGGQTPGTRNLSALPGSPARAVGSTSPTKPGAASFGKTDTKNRDERDEEEAMDTRSLLEKMEETVEGMKRRRSMNPRVSMGGNRMSLGLGMGQSNVLAPEGEFSLLAPGVKEELALSMQEQMEGLNEVQDDATDYKENANKLLEGEDNGGFNGEDELEASEGDEDIDHVAEPKTPTRASALTPRMDGLRQMFGEPRVTTTPSLTGMRDMFVHGNVRAMGTPAFEGIGEMMCTPEGYRYALNDEEIDEGGGVEVEMPSKKSNRVKTAASSRPMAALKKRKTPRADDIAEDAPTSVEKEATVAKGRRGRSGARLATSNDGDASIPVQKPKARLLRGQKALERAVEQETVVHTKTNRTKKAKEEDGEESSELTDTLAAKSKSSKPQSDFIREDEGQAPPPPPSKTVARRTRQTSNDSDTLNSEECLPQPDPPSKPARKTRTARSQSQTPAESESDVSAPVATRRTRAKGTAQATAGTTTTGTSRGRTKSIDIDGDDDPLDSIGSPEHDMCQEIDGMSVTKARRGTRSRTTTVEAIKEEPETPPSDTAAEKAGTAKGRKTAAKSSSGSATRASGRTKKGASPAPATSATPEDGFNKENAPDSIEEDEPVALEQVTKIKVTRSKKAPTRAKVETIPEAAEIAEPPARPRATRTRNSNVTRESAFRDLQAIAYSPSGSPTHQGRLPVPCQYNLELFKLLPTFIEAYSAAYETLRQGRPITCATTGTKFDSAPAPAAIILHFFGSAQLNATRVLSGSSVPVFAWVTGGASAIIRIFSPESLGGLGDFSSKIDVEVARTGRTPNEISDDETHGRIPGLPPMYDHEFFPQKLPFEVPMGPILRDIREQSL